MGLSEKFNPALISVTAYFVFSLSLFLCPQVLFDSSLVNQEGQGARLFFALSLGAVLLKSTAELVFFFVFGEKIRSIGSSAISSGVLKTFLINSLITIILACLLYQFLIKRPSSMTSLAAFQFISWAVYVLAARFVVDLRRVTLILFFGARK